MRTDVPNQMIKIKMEGYHLNIWNCCRSVCHNASTSLKNKWKYVLSIQINLRSCVDKTNEQLLAYQIGCFLLSECMDSFRHSTLIYILQGLALSLRLLPDILEDDCWNPLHPNTVKAIICKNFFFGVDGALYLLFTFYIYNSALL